MMAMMMIKMRILRRMVIRIKIRMIKMITTIKKKVQIIVTTEVQIRQS